MLTLHERTKYFVSILLDEKIHVYREYKPYWIKRLKNLCVGDTIKIYNAYTSNFLLVKVIFVSVKNYYRLPFYMKEYLAFVKTENFFDIEFKKI